MAELTSNKVCNICCIHYNAGLRCCALGTLVEGGYLFAKQGGLAWIIARNSRQVSRNWVNREDAVTKAQESNACGDWFVPSRTDLQLAHDCKAFWDRYDSGHYWSSTECNTPWAWSVIFRASACNVCFTAKSVALPIRAFRRVYY